MKSLRRVVRDGTALGMCIAVWWLVSGPMVMPPSSVETGDLLSHAIDDVGAVEMDEEAGKEPADLSLIELRAAMSAFVGRPVSTGGFVRSGDRIPHDRFLLYRVRLRCCGGSSTRPVPVAIFVKPDAELAIPSDDVWVRVEGIAEWEELDGLRVPVIRASLIDQVPRPRDPHIHQAPSL